jgi:hypothetical protein
MIGFLANAGLSNLRLQRAAPRAAAEPRRYTNSDTGSFGARPGTMP